MSNLPNVSPDRRKARTQRLIFDAFADLVQSRRYGDIQVADIVALADIGRSTFYEHFENKNDVLAQSLKGLFQAIANAATGRADEDNLNLVLAHIWDRRAFARIIFQGETGEITIRVLQDQIHQNLDNTNNGTNNDADYRAAFLSAGLIRVLNDWVTGRLSMNREALVTKIINCGA